MTTTLDPQFLRAVVLMADFKPGPMRLAKAALLAFALTGEDFTAAHLPAEITGGNKHLAGAASGALVSAGLLRVVDRVKSPNPNAKGRKLDVFRIAPGKANTIRAWFTAQQLTPPVLNNPAQLQLVAA